MHVELQSMAIEMPPLASHPNRVAFHGVLTLVGAPSDKPPAGARGHCVKLAATAAERALPSLLGMGLDYAPSLDRHDARRKVGVITEANLVTSKVSPTVRALSVSGYLYAKDFPEVVRELRMSRRQLGMSYEIADARVAEIGAAVWEITEFTFTGAALLRRDKAAYRDTWIELR